jgi:hypothetical protein
VSDPNLLSLLTGRVRAMQLIIVAMAMGVLAFLAVAFFVHTRVGAVDKTHKLHLVTPIALGYGIVALIGGPMLAGAMVTKGRRRLAQDHATAPPDAGRASGFGGDAADGRAVKLASLLVTKTILSGAIYEGAALFLGVAYLLNRGFLTAGCSLIMVAAILMQLPTRDRVGRWIEEQLRQIEQDGQAVK